MPSLSALRLPAILLGAVMTIASSASAGPRRHHPGDHQPRRHQGLAGRGLHRSDRHHEHRLPRRRGAGSGRQGRPRQPDVGPARRRRRRPRFARLPGEARGSQHQPVLRRRLRRLLRQSAHARSINEDEAFELFRLAVTEPRFDAEPVARIRGQIIANLRQAESNPNEIAGRLWARDAVRRAIPMAGRSRARSTASRRSPPTTCAPSTRAPWRATTSTSSSSARSTRQGGRGGARHDVRRAARSTPSSTPVGEIDAGSRQDRSMRR